MLDSGSLAMVSVYDVIKVKNICMHFTMYDVYHTKMYISVFTIHLFHSALQKYSFP